MMPVAHGVVPQGRDSAEPHRDSESETLTGQYDEATMKMRLFQKDIDVITDFAAGLACPTPLFSASSEIYAKALADGRDKQDTAAVCAVLEEMAGINPK